MATTAVAFAVLYAADPKERVVHEEPCGDRIFGHIASLNAPRWPLRGAFRPAWFTSGVTANTAAAEDGAAEPGEPVPNDSCQIDEGHRLLTYLVSQRASVTVLTCHGSNV